MFQPRNAAASENADWQRYQEPEYECHDAKLNGYWQSG